MHIISEFITSHSKQKSSAVKAKSKVETVCNYADNYYGDQLCTCGKK